MTETEANDLIASGNARVVIVPCKDAPAGYRSGYEGRLGTLKGTYSHYGTVRLDGDTHDRSYFLGRYEPVPPEPAPWKPGDRAVTDAYTQGLTEITLVADQHPRYWKVQPGDGKPYGLLYEEEFRRPTPVMTEAEERKAMADLAAPMPDPAQKHVSKPMIREPSIECEKDWAEATSNIGWHREIRQRLTPEEQKTLEADGLIAQDLLMGGLPALAKHLDALLKTFGGFTEEGRAAIVAQVEKGEDTARWSANYATTLTGIRDWMAKDRANRRVSISLHGHRLDLWVTILPSLRTRCILFREPMGAAHTARIIDHAISEDRDNGVVDNDGELRFPSRGLALLEADVALLDAGD